MIPVEWCRECRDERPMGAPGVPAEFILWGKLLPPEALGPRCYDHAAKHLGRAAMSRIDQYAVFDLRPFDRAAKNRGHDLDTSAVSGLGE